MHSKIIIFSNYAWVYMSSVIVKKNFPHSDITLVTKNTDDIKKRHDFGMRVIEFKDFKPKTFRAGLDAAIIDYGFSVSMILPLLSMRFKRIFIIDPNSKNGLKRITKLSFIKIVLRKMPHLFNKVLIQVSKALRMSVSLGLPVEITIETTALCNLKCKACPTGLGQLNRPSMMIPWELFNSIVNRNAGDFKYCDVIYPFLFGEPLLNKDISEYIRTIREVSSPYTRIEVHTNGNIRNSKDMVKRLLLAGADLISISVDGTDKEAYENFRKEGSFELVCDFVRNLSAAKKELGLLHPEIVIQMIPTKYSENQVGQFNRLKEDLGADRFVFKEFCHEFTGLSDEEALLIAPSKKELLLDSEQKKEMIRNKNNMCGLAYRSISIMCNGNVTPCCIDYNTSLLDGLNIKDASIREVWNSKRYRRFRRDMLNGKNRMCNKCFLS